MVDIGAQVGIAIPSFWVGLVLIYVLGITRMVPAGGYISLPGISGAPSARSFCRSRRSAWAQPPCLPRFVRSAMLDIMEEDYIRTGMSKGLTFPQALFRHGLRNAAIPVVTVGTLQLGNLLAGTLVVENIFIIPVWAGC